MTTAKFAGRTGAMTRLRVDCECRLGRHAIRMSTEEPETRCAGHEYGPERRQSC
jgi:hypothetical protein